jgi:hypothetical protein
MPDMPTPQPDPAARIAELEAELARVTLERDIYKDGVRLYLGKDDPEYDLTPEEVEDMLHGPRGEPLRDIVAEFERKLGGS